jgi:hypothetical protein
MISTSATKQHHVTGKISGAHAFQTIPVCAVEMPGRGPGSPVATIHIQSFMQTGKVNFVALLLSLNVWSCVPAQPIDAAQLRKLVNSCMTSLQA